MFPGIPFCSRSILRIVSALTIGILAVPSVTFGQSSYTWNGGGSDSNWSTGGNWGGSGPSSPQAYLNFAGTTKTTSNNNFGNFSPGFQIYFNSGAGAYTLTGNAVNFYNYGSNIPAIENDSTNLQTIQFQVDVENTMNVIANTGNLAFTGSNFYIDNSSNINFTANSGKTITVGDALNQATSGITIGSSIGSSTGGGTVIFSGTNTYTGATTINGGTLQLGNGGSTGSIASGNTIYFNVGSGTSASSGTLAINETGNPNITNNLTMNSASDWANVSVAAGQTATLSGAITGAGEFWTTGAGNLVITPNAGSASRSASNVISTGTITVSDFSSSTLGSGSIYVVGGAVNYSGSSTSTTRLGNFALQSATSAIGVTTTGTTLTLTNDLGGFTGGGLTKTGTGTLALSVAETYNGGTTVSAGTLLVNGGTHGSTTSVGTGSGAVAVNSGGTLAGSGNIDTASGVTVSAGGKIASGTTQTGAPNVTGAGLAFTNTGVTLSGTGAGALSANLTFDLGAGNPTSAAINSYSNPNTASTSMSLWGTSTITFTTGSTESVSLVDLTNGLLAMRQGEPYLLIAAGSDADYKNLVINSGTAASPVLSLSQNDTTQSGTVLGVWTGSGFGYTAIAINQIGSDGSTTLGSGQSYPSTVLYLSNGNLEVVPEPGTWALMLGGLALLVVIRRRQDS